MTAEVGTMAACEAGALAMFEEVDAAPEAAPFEGRDPAGGSGRLADESRSGGIAERPCPLPMASFVPLYMRPHGLDRLR